ncbi:MAG: repressor LexA [Planctomycetes bacterium]|nr:repressor LexA [Planctomycetota bacterium]
MSELTRAQRRVLEFVREHERLHGESPTLARIAAGIGLSARATVHRHVNNLVALGRLRKNSRGEIAASGRAVPLAGSIRAGGPGESCALVEDVAVPAWMATGGRMFALRVRGLSMRDAGILEGDIVLADASRQPKSGEIAVARLGTETTLKIYRETAEGVRLEAANPDFSAIAVRPEDDFEIQGVLVGLLRRY